MTNTYKGPALDTRKTKTQKAVSSLKVARGTTSFSAQVVELELGECCSRIGQLDTEMTLGEFAAQLVALKSKFRNNLMSSVRLAAAQTGAIYEVEVTVTVTTPGSIYLVAIVTRTK